MKIVTTMIRRPDPSRVIDFVDWIQHQHIEAISNELVESMRCVGGFTDRFNRSALMFTNTPIWVFRYNITRDVWELFDITPQELKRPMQFSPSEYLRDERNNIIAFYKHGTHAYAIVVQHRFLIFMDIDDVLRQTHLRLKN